MRPKKIYLRSEELEDNYMCERMVSCDVAIGSCNVEYTDLSQVWHDASEEPLKDRVFLTELGASKYGFQTFILAQSNIEFNWSEFVKEIHLLRWAYVSDLLPKIEEL